MAKAKVKYKNVRGVDGKKTGEQETRVKLDLSENEALFLADLLSKVGGCPDTTRRRHSAAMLEALQREGVHWDKSRSKDIDLGRSSIQILSGAA